MKITMKMMITMTTSTQWRLKIDSRQMTQARDRYEMDSRQTQNGLTTDSRSRDSKQVQDGLKINSRQTQDLSYDSKSRVNRAHLYMQLAKGSFQDMSFFNFRSLYHRSTLVPRYYTIMLPNG